MRHRRRQVTRLLVSSWRLLRRWIFGALVVGAAAILSVLVFAPQDRQCGSVTCGLVTNLIASGLVVLVAAASFVVVTRAGILRRYRRRLGDRPEEFLTGAAPGLRLASIQRRPQLCAALAAELFQRKQDRLQIVVAEAGAGKTAFLLDFAAWLVANGRVPVLVELRQHAPPLNIDAIARQRFCELVDHHSGSETTADRLWRQLVRHDLIVVCADGLDEAVEAGIHTSAANLCARSQLPMVITSRPDALTDDERRAAIELEPLDREALIARIGGGLGASTVVDRVGMTRTPFYLEIARAVPASDRLHSLPRDADAAQAALIRIWLDGLTTGDVSPDTSMTPSDRVDAVELSTALAMRALRDDCRTIDTSEAETLVADIPGAPDPDEVDYVRALTVAVRLGLVQPLAGRPAVRFRHPILVACLAAQGMRRTITPRVPWWAGAKIHRRPGEERLLACRLAAASGADEEAAAVTDALLERAANHRREDARLRFAATAARCVVRVRDRERDALRLLGLAYPHASLATRVLALDALAALGTPSALRMLWRIGRQATYIEEWHVVERLSERPDAGFLAVKDDIAQEIATCSAVDPSRADRREEAPMAAIAKFLPSIVDRLSTDRSDSDDRVKEAERLLRAVSEFVERTGRARRALGAEASLAQGFKHASRVTREAGGVGSTSVDDDIVRLATSGRFWYSRAMAVQAMARRVEMLHAANETTRAEGLLSKIEACRDDPHAFVAEAARLGHLACRRGLPVERYLWHDESAVVARSGLELASQTSRLLADLVLVLNMNEQLDPEDTKRKVRTNEALAFTTSIPRCMTGDGRRPELLGQRGTDPCPDSCGLHLCPYRPEIAHPAAFRGHLSPAFCRTQQQIARRRSPGPWQGSRWNLRQRRSLAGFWAGIERIDTGSPD